MVAFDLASQKRFTTDVQAHYVYGPRELTRWVRGIYEAIRPLEVLPVEGLVRVWAHEALLLFQDRLVNEEERHRTDENIDAAALEHFPTINRDEALNRPILFSNWTSKNYILVDRESLPKLSFGSSTRKSWTSHLCCSTTFWTTSFGLTVCSGRSKGFF
jgi:dynein heavy chain 1